MKKLFIVKIAAFSLMVMAVGCLALISSCKPEETLGVPVIESVTYYTQPGSLDPVTVSRADSLLLITGQNLSTTYNITFNGYPAELNTAFVTDTHIMIKIPNGAPTAADVEDITTISNELRVFTEGGEVVAPFKIVLNPPIISTIYNEFPVPGEVMTIYGTEFVKIQKVSFTNGDNASVDGTILNNLDRNFLKVKVPNGISDAGQIVVDGPFGIDTSGFKIRDRQYMLTDFDQMVPATGVLGDTAGVDGKYFQGVGKSFLLDYSSAGNPIPAGYIGNWSKNYDLKFEIKTAASLIDPLKEAGIYFVVEVIRVDGVVDVYKNRLPFQPYAAIDEFKANGFNCPNWKTMRYALLFLKNTNISRPAIYKDLSQMSEGDQIRRISMELVKVPLTSPDLNWCVDNVRIGMK